MFLIPSTGQIRPVRVCLDAKKVIDSNDGRCGVPADCASLACAVPVLGLGEYIMDITIADPKVKPILFAGTPQSLWLALEVSDKQPKFEIPILRTLPATLNKFWQWLFSISAGLGLLNMAPVYWLDGEWVLSALLRYLLPDPARHLTRQKISKWILRSGTALLGLNIALGLIVYILS